jgi:hypothetical protein
MQPDEDANRLGQYVSLEALRRAVTMASGAKLLEAYDQAGLGLLVQLPAFVTLMNAFTLPFLFDRLAHDRKPVEGIPTSVSGEAIFADVRLEDGYVRMAPDNPASLLRLAYAVLFVSMTSSDESEYEALMQPLSMLAQAIFAFAQQQGYPGADGLSNPWQRGEDTSNEKE